MNDLVHLQPIANNLQQLYNKYQKSIQMNRFSSQEIESQYNLIKTLLSDPEKYRNAINAIKKDIDYMPLELKKKLEEENITL